MDDTLSPENTLTQLVVDRVNQKKNFIQSSARGTGPSSVSFDVLPAVLIWFHTTNYPDDNAPKASGVGTQPDSTGEAIWVSEYPLLGAVVFGNNQEEALKACEELKQIVSGFWPQVDSRDTLYPLHPAHFAVPFPMSEAECVGIFFEIGWQFRVDITV